MRVPVPLFQYPRTDRMGCDSCLLTTTATHLWLSVSSNGSNGLRLPLIACASDVESFQYPRTDRMGCDARGTARMAPTPAPFSILERIEWAATRRSGGFRPPSGAFQYPRTDRMGCDAVGDGESDEVGVTFSILERIEWAATRRPEPEKVTRIAFSILERIEWAATAPPLPQPG